MVDPCVYLFCPRSLGLFDCWRIAVPHWHLARVLFVAQVKVAYDLAIRGLTALGMFAALMFALGYAYASIPVVLSKTCTPTFIDKLIK